MSPTQRSLKHMRDSGYLCALVEHWDHFARKRRDLLGLFDILCLGDGVTVAVQTTSGSNVAARVRKITDSDVLPAIRKCGWRVLVHGWTKGSNGRYRLREVDLS